MKPQTQRAPRQTLKPTIADQSRQQRRSKNKNAKNDVFKIRSQGGVGVGQPGKNIDDAHQRSCQDQQCDHEERENTKPPTAAQPTGPVEKEFVRFHSVIE